MNKICAVALPIIHIQGTYKSEKYEACLPSNLKLYD